MVVRKHEMCEITRFFGPLCMMLLACYGHLCCWIGSECVAFGNGKTSLYVEKIGLNIRDVATSTTGEPFVTQVLIDGKQVGILSSWG